MAATRGQHNDRFLVAINSNGVCVDEPTLDALAWVVREARDSKDAAPVQRRWSKDASAQLTQGIQLGCEGSWRQREGGEDAQEGIAVGLYDVIGVVREEDAAGAEAWFGWAGFGVGTHVDRTREQVTDGPS